MVRKRRKNVLTGTTRRRKIQPGRVPLPPRTSTLQGEYGFVRPDLQLFHLDQASRAYTASQNGAITPAMRQAATLLYNHQLRSAGVAPNVVIPGVAAPAVAPALPALPAPVAAAPAVGRAAGLAAAAGAPAIPAPGQQPLEGRIGGMGPSPRGVARGVRAPQAFPRAPNFQNGAQPGRWGPPGSIQGNPPAGSAPPLPRQNNLRGLQHGAGAGRPSLADAGERLGRGMRNRRPSQRVRDAAADASLNPSSMRNRPRLASIPESLDGVSTPGSNPQSGMLARAGSGLRRMGGRIKSALSPGSPGSYRRVEPSMSPDGGGGAFAARRTPTTPRPGRR